MTYDDLPHVRLQTWTDADDKPCYRVADQAGAGALSRHVDGIEAAQLGRMGRLLDRAREVAATPEEACIDELRALARQLSDILRDALLVAENRDARLGRGEWLAAGQLGGSCLEGEALALLEESRATPPFIEIIHDILENSPAVPHALGLRSFPGGDLATASAARQYVRDTARAWRLPGSVVDDLETVTGELTANALEHSNSRTVTVTLARVAGTAVVSVTDEGRGRRGNRPVPEPTSPPPEQEHGRGLLITEAVATRWGQWRVGACLTVWAAVEAS